MGGGGVDDDKQCCWGFGKCVVDWWWVVFNLEVCRFWVFVRFVGIVGFEFWGWEQF